MALSQFCKRTQACVMQSNTHTLHHRVSVCACRVFVALAPLPVHGTTPLASGLPGDADRKLNGGDELPVYITAGGGKSELSELVGSYVW